MLLRSDDQIPPVIEMLSVRRCDTLRAAYRGPYRIAQLVRMANAYRTAVCAATNRSVSCCGPSCTPRIPSCHSISRTRCRFEGRGLAGKWPFCCGRHQRSVVNGGSAATLSVVVSSEPPRVRGSGSLIELRCYAVRYDITHGA